MAVFCVPLVLSKSAPAPTAVLESASLRASAPPPTAVLELPVLSKKSERQPSAVFPAPVVLLMRASSPRNALKRLESQPCWQTARACGESANQVSTNGTTNDGVAFLR